MNNKLRKCLAILVLILIISVALGWVGFGMTEGMMNACDPFWGR